MTCSRTRSSGSAETRESPHAGGRNGAARRGYDRPAMPPIVRAPHGSTLSCKGWQQEAALRMLMAPQDLMLPLADALRAAADAVKPCHVCGNLDAQDPCAICRDPHRETRLVCVVEGVADLWALERSGAVAGRYHVLGGTLSPLDGIGPA